jgi:hypothetical protein
LAISWRARAVALRAQREAFGPTSVCCCIWSTRGVASNRKPAMRGARDVANTTAANICSVVERTSADRGHPLVEQACMRCARAHQQPIANFIAKGIQLKSLFSRCSDGKPRTTRRTNHTYCTPNVGVAPALVHRKTRSLGLWPRPLTWATVGVPLPCGRRTRAGWG